MFNFALFNGNNFLVFYVLSVFTCYDFSSPLILIIKKVTKYYEQNEELHNINLILLHIPKCWGNWFRTRNNFDIKFLMAVFLVNYKLPPTQLQAIFWHKHRDGNGIFFKIDPKETIWDQYQSSTIVLCSNNCRILLVTL